MGVVILLLASCGVAWAREAGTSSWVGTWSTSAQQVEQELLPDGFATLDDTTIRQVVHVSIGGEQLRLRISNAFADWNDGLEIEVISIALGAEGSGIKPKTAMPVTFNEAASVTVPYGVMMVSDPIRFDLPAEADLVVTMYFKDGTKRITGHRSARGEVTFLQSGNHMDAKELPAAAKNTCWYYLSGIDVPKTPSSAAVVCLGDSITDGKGSTPGANRRWPDLLAKRLQKNRRTAGIGVLNQGIGGNCLWRGGIGQTALQRLERDVLAQPGARWVIVMEGINDLGGGKTTAEELMVSYQQIVARAHDCGLKVYGVTILPCGGSFYDKPGMEAERQKVNEWIRSGGAFDAVLDFDAVVRDPDRPSHLVPDADCGDHLHLSDAGYRMLAESIDLALFEK